MGNAQCNFSDYRLQVIGGTIYLYKYASGSWQLNNTSGDDAWNEWNQYAKAGYEVQIGRQGKTYKLATIDTLAAPYGTLTLPYGATGGATETDVLEYKIVQPPRSTLSPPVVLPRGTVIDLAYSAGCIAPENPTNYNANKLPFNGSIQNILFTPNGYMDYNNTGTYDPYYGGLIYLCIGEWERGFSPSLAEDGKSNIETLTNFWVTLNPKTGQVRITEMAPAVGNDVQGARKYAVEHYGIGE
jgi:hypothetical protein